MTDRWSFVTLTSDFGVQSQSVAVMEATIFQLAPTAKIINFMHGLPSYALAPAARTLECLSSIACGVHVCVVDPGVGTSRRGIAVETGRGDVLVGPDNGVLMPAVDFIGGMRRAVELSNERFHHPTSRSAIFHGRDVFSPVAASIWNGVPLNEFGEDVTQTLQPGPYANALVVGQAIQCEVIQINKFGSLHLNILGEDLEEQGPSTGSVVAVLHLGKEICRVLMSRTFGEVEVGEGVLLRDDYGRVELALNQDSFTNRHDIALGDALTLRW